MNNIYHAKHVDVDYDQLNNIVVVADNMDEATKICFSCYGKKYGMHSFINSYKIEKIGVTDKDVGTIILTDY